MVINIPIQVDEGRFEELIARDYEGKVVQEIVKLIESTLIKNSSYVTYGSASEKKLSGMKNFIEARIDIFLKEHEDVLLEKAAQELATRLVRTKKGKEILGKFEDGNDQD